MINAKTIITFEDYKRWLAAVSDNEATVEDFQLLNVTSRQSIAYIIERWDDKAIRDAIIEAMSFENIEPDEIAIKQIRRCLRLSKPTDLVADAIAAVAKWQGQYFFMPNA